MPDSPTPPRASVVLTVHDRVEFLGEALRSALGQEMADLEVVVAHDGDHAAVRELVAGFDDPRLRYRRNHGEPGVVDNLLGAVGECRAPYLAVLNDDDALEPGFLAALLPQLDADASLAVAFCDHAIIDGAGLVDEEATQENTRRWHRDTLAAGVHRPFWREGLVDQSVPAVMGAVFRRAAVDWADFPREVRGAYDFWLTYLACRDGQGAAYVPARLTRYRVHGGQATRGRAYTAPGNVACLRRIAADERLPVEAREALRARLRATLLLLGGELVGEGRRSEARSALDEARQLGAAGLRPAVLRALAALPAPLGALGFRLARRGR